MPQPTDSHCTTKDLSPEELAQYRQRLNQHLQNRKVDEALLQRAWQTAYRVAAMLYEDFEATQVVVFGLIRMNWIIEKQNERRSRLAQYLTVSSKNSIPSSLT